MPAWSVSGESALPGLLMATFLLHPHVAERETEREMSPLVSLLIEILTLLDESPTLMTLIDLNYFCKGTISKHSHIRD